MSETQSVIKEDGQNAPARDHLTEIRLADYQPPVWLVPNVSLEFTLRPSASLVKASLTLRPNYLSKAWTSPDPATIGFDRAIVLMGGNLNTQKLVLNGQELAPIKDYQISQGRLWINYAKLEACGWQYQGKDSPSAILTSEVVINPEDNKALMGLYRSSGLYCTQCEAEGFRRITWFPDRPDVLSIYEVTLRALKQEAPILLSNGNLTSEGELADGWHYACFSDPFPKPCYLFALVAGELEACRGSFITQSGRCVRLNVWVAPGKVKLADHALTSLQKAMKWDEDRFGLEYDLDVFHIVAVEDFNFGAMENKSLNIFNSKYVLADPLLATDADYEAIEAVVAHEYFHNWTGNRVTCRDWFQLSLKEGLTVFRDQSFSEDMRDRDIARLSQINVLKSQQFPEDAGPLAHPIRPDHYVEINNFYTATVYEKGAEVIRMLQTLLGREGFAKGLSLYLNRHDGEAVTCEDFIQAMEDANHYDLRQFHLWYGQIGTPEIEISRLYDAKANATTLKVSQHCSHLPSMTNPVDGQDYDGLLIPLLIGVTDAQGQPCPTISLQVTKAFEIFTLVNIGPSHRLTFNHQFAAPIKLKLRGESKSSQLKDNSQLDSMDQIEDWLYDYRYNADSVTRNEAFGALQRQIGAKHDLKLIGRLTDAMIDLATDDRLAPRVRAELIRAPHAREWMQYQTEMHPDRAVHLEEVFQQSLAKAGAEIWPKLWQTLRLEAPSAQDLSLSAVGLRAFSIQILARLAWLPDNSLWQRETASFILSRNMTERSAGLAMMVTHAHPSLAVELARFRADFSHSAQAMDKWFAMQAAHIREDGVEFLQNHLLNHADYQDTNPNRVRSVLGAFSAYNLSGFHRQDGMGYSFMVAEIIRLDRQNPMLAARLATIFGQWRKFAAPYRELMQERLQAMISLSSLSNDTAEIIKRSLQ